MNKFQLSIIIPVYNETCRIVPTLNHLVKYLSSRDFKSEVIICDDGSTDDTLEVVREFSSRNSNVPEPSIRTVSLPHRVKGNAVREGMILANGKIRLMCDADLAMSVEQIDKFLHKMAEGYDVVIGSREVKGARRFDEPKLRHFMGKIFNWYVRIVAVGGFSDTQCGYKCFTSNAANILFKRQKLDGWSFDVELLMMATRKSMKIFELPIDWYHKERSKVSFGPASIQMVRDTLLTRIRYELGMYRCI